MKQITTKAQGGKGSRPKPTQTASAARADFAAHLSAALKIAREQPGIPAHLYNDLATAWNDFTNTIPSVDTLR